MSRPYGFILTELFLAVARRAPRSVSGTTVKASDAVHGPKPPAPKGWTAAAIRGVVRLARWPRIALRRTPGGLIRRDTIRMVPYEKDML